MTVCNEHMTIFVTRYEARQIYCRDTKNKHKRKVREGLRAVSLDSYALLERKTGIQLSPGDKLCTNCFAAYNQSAVTAAPRDKDYYSPHDETYETGAAESRTINRHALNSSLETVLH